MVYLCSIKTQSYLMGQRIKKLKKIRLHREGTDQLVYGMIAIVAIAAILWSTIDNKIPFWIFVVVFGTVYGIVLNFYRCPIRYLNIEDTDNLVVAPADGKIVVIEEVDNAPYFNDRRLMISIFMSLWNVHAKGKRGERACRHNDYHTQGGGCVVPTDCWCRSTPYRNLCQGGRGVLY